MRMPVICSVAATILMIGCQRHAAQPTHGLVDNQQDAKSDNREAAVASYVIVIGDHTATDVLQHLKENEIRGWTDLTDLAYAKLIIVAQDATQGLTIHDDILDDLQPQDGKRVLWLMTNCDLLDDRQLLELEELEARDLLNRHGLPGDAIPFALDSGTAPAESIDDILWGWAEIKRYISEF